MTDDTDRKTGFYMVGSMEKRVELTEDVSLWLVYGGVVLEKKRKNGEIKRLGVNNVVWRKMVEAYIRLTTKDELSRLAGLVSVERIGRCGGGHGPW